MVNEVCVGIFEGYSKRGSRRVGIEMRGDDVDNVTCACSALKPSNPTATDPLESEALPIFPSDAAV